MGCISVDKNLNIMEQTMKDETYDYCNAEECPYMANGDLEDHVIELDGIPDYPQELSLAYDNHCNYKCT